MKTLAFAALVLLSSLSLAGPGDTVYYAKKGKVYHTESCSYLKHSVKIKSTVKEATAKGLRPCTRCHPPTMAAGISDIVGGISLAA